MSNPHFKQKGYQRRSADAVTGSSPVLTTNKFFKYKNRPTLPITKDNEKNNTSFKVCF